MTEQPVGPRCGNNPNVQLTPGDQKAVDDFKARLALQASAKPYIDSAAWVDGDPLMEVIAVTVYERCETGDGGIVHDDPRTIAAFAAAVARAHAAVPSAPADQTALRDRIAAAIWERQNPGRRWVDCEYRWRADAEADADAVLAVLPAPADREAGPAALREAAAFYESVLHQSLDPDSDPRYCTAVRDVVMGLRHRADEAQQPETQAENPARIDGLRPEFAEHASVESIDVQLRRARSQERRWHIRTEWLISLRQARVMQKERGEWPAAVSQPGKEATQ
jgi:hypothetical protein